MKFEEVVFCANESIGIAFRKEIPSVKWFSAVDEDGWDFYINGLLDASSHLLSALQEAGCITYADAFRLDELGAAKARERVQDLGEMEMLVAPVAYAIRALNKSVKKQMSREVRAHLSIAYMQAAVAINRFPLFNSMSLMDLLRHITNNYFDWLPKEFSQLVRNIDSGELNFGSEVRFGL